MSLYALNLKKLLGSQNHLVFNLQLVHNGYSVSIRALGDTGADGFIFLDTNLAILMGQRFGAKTVRLPQECPVEGFDGKPAKPITHAMILNLIIDGRMQKQTPMLIADLGRHDLILGRMWFEKYGALIDCKYRRLIWPKEASLQDEVVTKLQTPIPKQILQRPRNNRQHQLDANRRDRNFERNDPKNQNHRTQGQTNDQDQQNSLVKIRRDLQGIAEPAIKRTQELEPRRRPEQPPKRSPVEIAMIGAVGFHRHMQKEGTETFVTSLYEINRIIEEKQEQHVDATEASDIQAQLPAEYHEYTDVFSKGKSDTMPPYRKGVDHQIKLEKGLDLGYCPLYKQTAEELEFTKSYILDNLHKGFIEPGTAPFASPILMAKKPGGGLRFCVDYRKLNAITKKDRYPLPLIDELIQRVSKAKFFTRLDIRQGFHRIRMDPDSEDLTTFRSRYGTFKYKVMPFGLTNAPATFQRYLNATLADYLDDFCTAFVDDILIYSETFEEHQRHVKLVLQRLREASLQAALHKCEFHVQKTRFLGFLVSTEGIEVDPSKIEAVTRWEQPGTVRGVQSFLGFCNFYRRFIKNYSRIAKPLHHLTRKETVFEWTSDCQKAFRELKRLLTVTPILVHYDLMAPTQVETDASDGVVGGVLSQQDDLGVWHPVAYFSKTMQPAERAYDIYDKEMLAIILALQEWRAELEGLQRDDRFNIMTDHQALEYFMTKRKLNARQIRWLEKLSHYHFLIKYRPGRRNTLADALSRKETSPEENQMQVLLPRDCLDQGVHPDDQAMSIAPIAQEVKETVVPRVLTANRNHESLEEWRQEARQGDDHWTLRQGLLLFEGKLVVPHDRDLRARLLDEIHRQAAIAHPGPEKMKKLVAARYYWPELTSDVERYGDNCKICKRTKAWRDKTPGLLQPLPIPHRPWQHISMDFRSFPKDKRGFDTVFVVVDRLTKRPISIPCHKTTTAKQMAQLFVDHILRWVGLPDTIVSDRGGQFVSEFWTCLCKILGVKQKLSTAHHPQTDGQSEIANQYMAQRLRPYVNYNQDDWSDYLALIDLAAATLPQDTTQASPFFVERGYEPRVSFDWDFDKETPDADAHAWAARMQTIWDDTRERIAVSQERQRTQANKHRRPATFEAQDWVYVTAKNWNLGRPSKKLGDQCCGPFKILAREGNAYRLELPASMKVHPVFSPDKLRRAAKTKPLEGQLLDPAPEIEIDGHDEWEVEQIQDSRLHYRKLQYRVKWLGFDDNDLTWYPASNFKNAPQALQDFHAAYPTKPGPPARLQEWIRAALQDEYLADYPDDDKSASSRAN